VILLYHRVAEVDRDPFRLAVPPERFEHQLGLIKEEFSVETLDEFVNDFPPVAAKRTVIVTFDDGYADTLETAHPIMAKLGLPLTVFVTAGPLLGQRSGGMT
jgi:peptidoglycan/xylan/chitin deacetylase (PgdA/CDA1 family)